jgi:transcriptional regulator with XRE-family HTH domain
VSTSPEIRRQLNRFGANLRRERLAQAMTQEVLAERADLNIRTLQKIEAGQTNILITTAQRLRNALGCEWNRLLG